VYQLLQEFDKGLLFQSLALLLVENAGVIPESKINVMSAVVNCSLNIICKSCTDINVEKYVLSSQGYTLLYSFCFVRKFGSFSNTSVCI